jgi:hypothetical protein
MDKPIGFRLTYSFQRFKNPKWLNLAIGYGADGLLEIVKITGCFDAKNGERDVFI